MFGAGNEARTRDLNLGKVALYQLSYSRIKKTQIIQRETCINRSWLNNSKQILKNPDERMEARAGVEPTYTDLQSGA
jgi:hypothetical protein